MKLTLEKNRESIPNKPIKQRSLYWDNIKGILIFLVVFSHFLWDYQSNETIKYIVQGIYLFHMPAFIFVSGYFSKSEHSRSSESIFKLVFAYLIFNTGIMLIYGWFNGFNATIPYYSYWYLLALIVWKFTVKWIAKIKYVMVWLVLAALAVGFWQDIGKAFAFSRIIVFYPFFMAGYLCDKEQLKIFKEKKAVFVGIVAFIAAALVGAVALMYLTFTNDSLTMFQYNIPEDALGRCAIFFVSLLAIIGLLSVVPDKNIPLINKFGRNSISIYLLHRPITLALTYYLPVNSHTGIIIALGFVLSVLFCLILSEGIIFNNLEKLLAKCVSAVIDTKAETKKHLARKIVSGVLVVVILFLPIINSIVISITGNIQNNNSEPVNNSETTQQADAEDKIYPCISAEKQSQIDNSFKIIFSGDLLLLEDQVRNAYNGENYDFSSMFEYTKEYLSSADLAIGVFEGPLAGADAGYSSSNYDDGKELYLNFPDEFAKDIKDSGIDLVTLSNNHLLDRGEKGASRTIDTLKNIGLDYTGAYKNKEDKTNNRVKVLEKDGMKFAVLSYTYGVNNYEEKDLFGDVEYVTSALADPNGEFFEIAKKNVVEDFEYAKSFEPDFIIVLPHMGTQFATVPDDYQKEWCNIFKENGADIILGDHTHSVQPVEITAENENKVFTAYCPGNYANIYREYDGDASTLIEVYIDRESKTVIGGGIIPMWTQSSLDGNYRPLPIYDIINNETLKNEISTYEMERIQQVNELITNVMLGETLSIDMVRERYIFDENGFMRSRTEQLEISDNMKSGTMYKALSKAENVCFLGDSVTEGTKNGGVAWYEPIETLVSGKLYNCSKGGGTVNTLIEKVDNLEAPDIDLYVIAIGTNDVRYRNESECAMTSDAYTEKLKTLVDKLKKFNPQAEFIFIAPWTSTDGDPYCSLSYSEKIKINDEYSSALEKFCKDNNYGYINANEYINSYINLYPSSDFLLDHIHPNSTSGVRLYSEAVMLYESNQ